MDEVRGRNTPAGAAATHTVNATPVHSLAEAVPGEPGRGPMGPGMQPPYMANGCRARNTPDRARRRQASRVFTPDTRT